MNIVDLNGDRVNIEVIEKHEQDLANQYILENDVVLELGARYGSVSCIINSKLINKTNQVVVEPDERVWDSLEKNKNSLFGPYYYFTDFENAQQQIREMTEPCKKGIVRFAIFTGKILVFYDITSFVFMTIIHR